MELHYYLKSREYTIATVHRLVSKSYWSLLDVLYAGKQIHYLTDYFCAVHQESGLKKPRKHIEYEKALHRFFSECNYEMPVQVSEVCPNRTNWLDELHDKYMWHKDGVEKDLQYSIVSCKKILNIMLERRMNEKADVAYRKMSKLKGKRYIRG